MSAMIYENGVYKEAETPKVWNGSAFADTDGYCWENGVQKEGWSGNEFNLLVDSTKWKTVPGTFAIGNSAAVTQLGSLSKQNGSFILNCYRKHESSWATTEITSVCYDKYLDLRKYSKMMITVTFNSNNDGNTAGIQVKSIDTNGYSDEGLIKYEYLTDGSALPVYNIPAVNSGIKTLSTTMDISNISYGYCMFCQTPGNNSRMVGTVTTWKLVI